MHVFHSQQILKIFDFIDEKDISTYRQLVQEVKLLDENQALLDVALSYPAPILAYLGQGIPFVNTLK